eukprot:gnl/TRDRNA2_/TRDRNA2_185698_c0_seq1.p1 gnl/TRDRNA2_/TRDRNA2_185698_c0~~gnl/TRDRNA2_/TRDRNA2_185698_c0_seq1.p1  ORF type:complete len:557 (+),score=54.08 gnl/TRDRNA2_/TRDRNA2_185698_c0_seq1:48-1673(+)
MLLDPIPVAVDSFSHAHPSSLLFFCSHAHADHLSGLNNRWGSQGRAIYCSPVTAKLLASRWPGLAETKSLAPLSLGSPHRLRLPGSRGRGSDGGDGCADNGAEIEVWLLDAHHVPGAVMFVFSGSFGSVLHTGDFRLHPEHALLGTLPPLSSGKLTRVFLDNTFCHPIFRHPPRSVAEAEMIDAAVKAWPCVLFVVVYQLGKESLLSALSRRFETRVVVPESRVPALLAAGLASDTFAVEPCSPNAVPADMLWRLGLCGCIWVVSRAQLRHALERACSFGVPARGFIPSGWAATASGRGHGPSTAPPPSANPGCGNGISQPSAPLEAETETAMTAPGTNTTPAVEEMDTCSDDADDGDSVREFAYSDHCSFLELVQFLSFLPLAPVTFNSPLPKGSSGRFGYNGEEGVKKLQELTGVPCISYEVSDNQGQQSTHRRPRRTPRDSQAQESCTRSDAPARCANAGRPGTDRVRPRAQRVDSFRALPAPGLLMHRGESEDDGGIFPGAGAVGAPGQSACSQRSRQRSRSRDRTPMNEGTACGSP